MRSSIRRDRIRGDGAGKRGATNPALNQAAVIADRILDEGEADEPSAPKRCRLCPTILSRYNVGDLCGACTGKEKYRLIQAGATESFDRLSAKQGYGVAKPRGRGKKGETI